MAAAGKVRLSYVGKFLAFAVVLFGYGGLCVYDALVRYPAHNRRFAAFYHFQSSRPAAFFDEQGAPKGWESPAQPSDFTGFDDYASYAAAQGWDPQEQPGEPHTESDIRVQWIQLAVAATLGLGFLGFGLIHVFHRLETDDATLTGPGGSRVPFGAVRSIDKSRWDSKGIALVHYERNGSKGVVKIDDFVYDGAERVLEEVESQTGMGGVL